MRNYCRSIGVWSDENLCCYTLSDSSLATAFLIFFVTNRSSLPSKLGKPLLSTNSQEAESRIQARNHPSLHFALKVGNMSF